MERKINSFSKLLYPQIFAFGIFQTRSLTPKLKQKLKTMIQDKIAIDPYSGKKLIGDLAGFYSMRLSYRDRIIYTINNKQKLIYIHRAKTHYGE